jgi:hypothetical protein
MSAATATTTAAGLGMSELGVCESCRRRPATVTWSHPAAGAPFALCTGCAPTDDTGAVASVGGER